MAPSLGDGKSSGGLKTMCVRSLHTALKSCLLKTNKRKFPLPLWPLQALTVSPSALCLHLLLFTPEGRATRGLPVRTVCKPGAYSISNGPCSCFVGSKALCVCHRSIFSTKFYEVGQSWSPISQVGKQDLGGEVMLPSSFTHLGCTKAELR